MLLSYRWLERHIDLTGTDAEEVARLLTLHTAEVEGVERVLPHLDDVVVGFVVERQKHPDADKLSLCRVDVGTGENLSIVCGAPNVDAGQKVAVARVGTVLPGDFKIKKSKIRGQESHGMICSVRELELGDEHDGIWVLAEDAEVGTPVSGAVGLLDWALEIDNKAITHRPDLWGHRGMARELAAILDRELHPLDLTLPETGGAAGAPVRIETEGCTRYVALEVGNVRTGGSPPWLRHLLLSVGQRPIELTVDVSNFVMLDLGQPNHLFDRARVGGEGIVVRDARAGESLTTLDGMERKLETADMLICSGDEPVALAGVMGGEASMVADETTALLLEVASFHAATVRRTSARLGLRTDASARFEKSLDPNLPIQAAAHLVRTLAAIQPDIELPSPPTDAGPWTDPSVELELRPERLRKLLGAPIEDTEIARMLGKLDFVVVPGDPLRVRVPSFRATKDVSIEEDLIEEVGRLYGLTRIAEAELTAAVRPVPRDARRDAVRAIQDRLAGGARFHEVLTYSFLPEELCTEVGAESETCVEVVNPVSEGWQRVRRSVVPSLLGLLQRNLRNTDDVRLFEVGKGYLPEHTDERGQPREVHEVGMVWAAPAPGKRARFDADRLSELKGVVEELLAEFTATFTWSAASDERPRWSHPGRRLVASSPGRDGTQQELAFLSGLDPRIARSLGVAADVAVARLSIDALLALPDRGSRYTSLPKFPGVKIDVALAVPEERRAAELVHAIERAGKGLVADVELFDLYRGEQVGEGRKSLAYHVLLQSETKTLSDKDGQKFLARIEQEAEKLGGELRKE